MPRLLRIAFLALTVALVAGLGIPPRGAQSGESLDAGRIPMIEALAPGAFDPGVPAQVEAEVTYRVDATIRLPLLFGSIPVAGRTDVGIASFRVRDLARPAPGARTLRAYEFRYVHDDAVFILARPHAQDRPRARPRLPRAGVDCPRRSSAPARLPGA